MAAAWCRAGMILRQRDVGGNEQQQGAAEQEMRLHRPSSVVSARRLCLFRQPDKSNRA
jgi:hypothetical protein